MSAQSLDEVKLLKAQMEQISAQIEKLSESIHQQLDSLLHHPPRTPRCHIYPAKAATPNESTDNTPTRRRNYRRGNPHRMQAKEKQRENVCADPL